MVVEAGDGVAEADRAEQGRPPTVMAVAAASQAMAAIGVPPFVPCSMNRLVKSSRWRNLPLAMRSSVPASSGSRPAAQARRAATRSSVFTGAFGSEGGGGDVAVGGDAEVDVLASAGDGGVGLGEFAGGGGEADLESFGFAGPAFAFGFGDAGVEVVADFFEAVALGGVDSQEWASDGPLTDLSAMFPHFTVAFWSLALACPRERIGGRKGARPVAARGVAGGPSRDHGRCR